MSIKLFLIVGILAALFVGALGLLTDYISPQDKLEKADVIVAISGGNTKSRAQEAINLYKDGWAPNIIFSGAALDPLSPSNAEIMSRVAASSGVPENVITVEEEARDTEENAIESKPIVEAFNYDSIILVTSPYHQRRAYLEFRNTLGDEVKIINHSAPDSDWSEDTWWFSPRGWWLTTSETIKIPFSLAKELL